MFYFVQKFKYFFYRREKINSTLKKKDTQLPVSIHAV